VPPSVDGIQVNYCRNARCVNFVVNPLPLVTRGRPRSDGERVSDGYHIVGSSSKRSPSRRTVGRSLHCSRCGSTTYLRSNQAVVEELQRISAYLAGRPEPSCGTPACANHGKGVWSNPRLYHRNGRTAAGSRRWRCKACWSNVSDGKKGRAQRRSNENLTVFRALVNKSPIRSIARLTELSPKAVYDKIAFIHEQCLAFVADRERRLPQMELRRLWLSTDRQDYTLNWADRANRRNTQLTAVATADNVTGYVFGQHLNYDPDAVVDEVVALAEAAGDFDGRDAPFKRYARLWLPQDYADAVRSDPGPRQPRRQPGGVEARIAERLEEADLVDDPEALDRVFRTRTLPRVGMQTHVEYTVMAHFLLLRRLVGHAGKIRFFIDQDDTLWAGCLGTFGEKIRAGLADVLYVRIDKDRTVDERKRLVRETAAELDRVRKAIKKPEMDDRDVRRFLISLQLTKLDPSLPWRKRWVYHPQHTLYEPDKAVCYASDRGDMDLMHLAALMDRASLHGIDRFFMQLRRMLSPLERPIATPSNVGRVWRGYSAYNPLMVQRMIDIYRVYYNYAKLGEPWKIQGVRMPRGTPAMRIGLARGPVRVEDILYFGR
jgi:hypothetical protein